MTQTSPVDPGREGGGGSSGQVEKRRMGSRACGRASRRGNTPVAIRTRLGSHSPSPTRQGLACEWGSQKPGVNRHTGRSGSKPLSFQSPAHLSREWPHAPVPRSNRVATSTTAAMLGLRPTTLSSFPLPSHTLRPPCSPARRSVARFRCAERKQLRETRSGGSRAAGDRGGRVGPRPGPGRNRGHGAAAARLGRAGPAGPAAMSGYARRPGVTPLSRARSLVIPDGERPGGCPGPGRSDPGACGPPDAR